jgi:hypothetical protein
MDDLKGGISLLLLENRIAYRRNYICTVSSYLIRSAEFFRPILTLNNARMKLKMRLLSFQINLIMNPQRIAENPLSIKTDLRS